MGTRMGTEELAGVIRALRGEVKDTGRFITLLRQSLVPCQLRTDGYPSPPFVKGAGGILSEQGARCLVKSTVLGRG